MRVQVPPPALWSSWRIPAAFERRMHPAWTLRSALLLIRIALLFSLVAPCQAGASPLSVLTLGSATNS